MTSASRTVYQFHYTSWPDFGVPTNVTAFLNFVKLIKHWEADNTAPTVVHCRFVLLVLLVIIACIKCVSKSFYSNLSEI